MTRDWPKHSEDKIDYLQKQKHGTVEIFVTLRLPINAYETAAGLYRIGDYRTFDDYVSDCVMSDLDTMTHGEIADDVIISKITGRNSPVVQEQKKIYGGFRQRMEDRIELEQKMKEDNEGEPKQRTKSNHTKYQGKKKRK